MAILSFVYGGLTILGVGCGGAVYFVFLILPEPAPGQPNPFPNAMKFLAQEVPSYTAYMTVSVVLGVLMATLLILAGIGLLRLRPWARWACIIYAVVQLLVQVVGLYYTIHYVNPAMVKWSQDLARKLPPGTPNFAASPVIGNLSTFLGAALGMAFAIALLVVMFLPHVRAAFNGQGVGTLQEPEDYHDPMPGGSIPH
jgi:hypothetical protein